LVVKLHFYLVLFQSLAHFIYFSEQVAIAEAAYPNSDPDHSGKQWKCRVKS